MRKVICSLLIITILMNFICCNSCFAAGQSDSNSGNDSLVEPVGDSSDPNTATDILEDGKTNVNGNEVSTDTGMGGFSILGTVIGALAFVLDMIPLQLHVLLSVTTTSTEMDVTGSLVNPGDVWISIERIIFNRVALFNANPFELDSEYSIGSGSHKVIIKTDTNNVLIKENIAKWYYFCRILSLIISLFVLIYIGIRMAISTISSDKAKYKKMLISWVESVVILFILTYIMILIMDLGETLTSVFYNIKKDLEISGEKSFEVTIINQIFDAIFNLSGYKFAFYSIMYWVLVFTHLKFYYLYIKRMLMVSFLVIIAPLITITYPIDKAGDGKAQAFNNWLQEFCINVLIQPLHCIIYIVFMFTASEIAVYAPMIGLIFLMSLGTVEKTIKRLFNVNKSASLGSLGFKKKGK